MSLTLSFTFAPGWLVPSRYYSRPLASNLGLLPKKSQSRFHVKSRPKNREGDDLPSHQLLFAERQCRRYQLSEYFRYGRKLEHRTAAVCDVEISRDLGLNRSKRSRQQKDERPLFKVVQNCHWCPDGSFAGYNR